MNDEYYLIAGYYFWNGKTLCFYLLPSRVGTMINTTLWTEKLLKT